MSAWYPSWDPMSVQPGSAPVANGGGSGGLHEVGIDLYDFTAPAVMLDAAAEAEANNLPLVATVPIGDVAPVVTLGLTYDPAPARAFDFGALRTRLPLWAIGAAAVYFVANYAAGRI